MIKNSIICCWLTVETVSLSFTTNSATIDYQCRGRFGLGWGLEVGLGRVGLGLGLGGSVRFFFLGTDKVAIERHEFSINYIMFPCL